MSHGSYGDRERTFALSDRANVLMRDYGSSATPQAYSVWYAYVSGTQPLMNDAIKRLTTENGSLSDSDVDSLYETYVDSRRLVAATERMNANMLAEIEGIMEVMDPLPRIDRAVWRVTSGVIARSRRLGPEPRPCP